MGKTLISKPYERNLVKVKRKKIERGGNLKFKWFSRESGSKKEVVLGWVARRTRLRKWSALSYDSPPPLNYWFVFHPTHPNGRVNWQNDIRFEKLFTIIYIMNIFFRYFFQPVETRKITRHTRVWDLQSGAPISTSNRSGRYAFKIVKRVGRQFQFVLIIL